MLCTQYIMYFALPTKIYFEVTVKQHVTKNESISVLTIATIRVIT